MKWEDAESEVAKAQAGPSLKLKDGDKAVVAFYGNPKKKLLAFVDGKAYEGDEIPRGVTPSVRMSISIVNLSAGAILQTWDTSPTTFNKLNAVRKKYGFDKKTFEISRSGSGMQDTEYSILPEGEIDADVAALIKAASLGDDDLAF